MNRTRNTVVLSFAVLLVALLILSGPVSAGLLSRPLFQSGGSPQVMSYQGQVTVNGIAYTGTGYFKFAVVDAAGTTTTWSNNSSSTAGSEPSAAVTLTVTNGLFNVLLGDTSLVNMTTLPASAFNGTDRVLRVWFSSDGATFTRLNPDRRIAAVPYALQADSASALQGQPVSDTVPLDGQALVWSGGAWSAQEISGTVGPMGPQGPAGVITAGVGLTLNAGLISLLSSYQLPQVCTNGQVAKWNGASWACAADDGTVYAAGFGLNLAANQFSVATGTVQVRVTGVCASGSSIRVINADGTVTCQSDTGVTDHGALTGLLDDDHPQYFSLNQNESVAGVPAFNGGTSGTSAPFSVDSTMVVNNLNADLLDGQDASAFAASTHNHDASYINENQAAGGDLTGTYPNPVIAANAVGSSKIVDGGVDMADTVNWMGSGADSTTFSSGGYIYLYGPSFTPSANGQCMVMVSAAIVSGGSADTGTPPVLDTIMSINGGAPNVDPVTQMPFSAGDVTSSQPIGASVNWVWNVAAGQATRFGCRINDPDGAGADWGSDETARCRIAYICQ